LPLKLRPGELHGHDGHQTLADGLAGNGLLILAEKPLFPGVVINHFW
jgi:hypothetical protein